MPPKRAASLEYEVEKILFAKVEKKGRKKIWHYRVKWKNFDNKDNTWEPIESFVGSEQLVEQFWNTADLKGKNYTNLTEFNVGDSFSAGESDTPQRPARGRPPKKTEPNSASAPVPKASGSRRKRKLSSSPVPSTSKQDPPTKKQKVQSQPSKAKAPTKSTRRTRLRESPPVPTSEVDEAEELTASQSSTSQPPKHSKHRWQRAGSKPEEEMDTNEEQVTSSPRKDGLSPKDIESADVEASPPKDVAASQASPTQEDVALPSVASSSPTAVHRTRQPLIRTEAPAFTSINNAITAKTRLLGQASGETTGAPASGSSSALPRKGAPIGLKKPTGSLLTFTKGALKTVRRKETNTLNAEHSAPVEDTFNPVGDDVNDDIAQESNYVTESSYVVEADPEPVPTGQDLLKMAGLPDGDDVLPDFEEDAPPSLVVNTSSPAVDSPAAQNRARVENNLFPASSSSTPMPSRPEVWKRTSIFGPLGLGSLTLNQQSTNSSDASHETITFALSLSSATDIPMKLFDIHPSVSGGPTLNFILQHNSNRRAGKFYSGDFALAVLATLRTGGASGRVEIDASQATALQEVHFERFRERLDRRELFIAMAGVEVLAYCSSKDTFLAERLNIPQALMGREGSVLVCRVIIEDSSAYADAAMEADPVRW